MDKNELRNLFGEMKRQAAEKDFVDLAINSMLLDPISVKNLTKEIASMPLQIRDAIYWNKFYLFIKGINDIQSEYSEAIRLSDKLFSNENKRQENGMRLLSYIDKADSEVKVQYMINATRSFLLSLVNVEDYFRMIRAIVETLYEDLVYLSEIAIKTDLIKGNTRILALSRSGMAIQAGIDGNENIERQDYAVTEFGRMVDRYAISLENDERQQYYEKNQSESIPFDLGIKPIPEEEINAMFQD